jgi:DNA replication and repair protein RecF
MQRLVAINLLDITSLDHLNDKLTVEPDIFHVHQGEIERK